jgi:chromosomal replication initiator protein
MSVLSKIIEKIFSGNSKPMRNLTRSEEQINKVLDITSSVTGINKIDILGRRRAAKHVEARHISMFICAELLGMSYSEIGRAFGRDHTTVFYAHKKLRKRTQGRTSLNTNLKKVTERMTG